MSINEGELAWPPLYRIKKHKAAKRVKLKTSLRYGLEIIIPYRFKLQDVPMVLEENKAWIIKQLSKLKKKDEGLPKEIILNALNETILISYVRTNNKLQMIERPHSEIVFVGDTQDEERCRQHLNRWVRKKAAQFLLPQLQHISEMLNLPYQAANVRNQTTLWGSCTSQKIINLNFKLIFLPLALANHVLIHELCHTVHLNHSDAFWRLVEKFDADWQNHKRALKHADDYIPGWMT